MWQVAGPRGKAAAQLLTTIRSLKQRQLHIAASFPACKDARAEAAGELRNMKTLAEKAPAMLSWEYVAGFFDAEGCVYIPPTFACINLKITQKHKPILASIHKFLLRECPELVSHVRSDGRGAHIWDLARTEGSRFVLQRLLSSGLLAKRQAAEIALTLTQDNHLDLREQLSKAKGNQGRYLRLDDAGCRRARDIFNLNRSMHQHRCRGNQDTAQSLQCELQELRRQHASLNAEARVAKIRRDIRCLLQQGATRVGGSIMP